MLTKSYKINPLELKGNDRVFQLDRDTIILYTGLHLEDIKPFARIGAGSEYPFFLSHFIESVLLPERNMWNAGIEEMWLRMSLDMNTGKIKYVGSKEMLSYLQRYFDLEQLYSTSRKEEKIKLPVEYQIYSMPRPEIEKDRSTIIYLATGEYQVNVGGSRVFDSGNYFRARLTIDKEYNILKKILSKVPLDYQQRSKYSFFLFSGSFISVLFHLNGQYCILNPLSELHYRLFEMQLDPDCISMAITSSPYLPGFVELFRRADILEKEIAVSFPDVEKLNLLKRIYYLARPKFFSDGSTLPLAKFVNYYESKTKSHASLNFRLRDDVEEQIKILFPLLNQKESRNFDYIKGPFDIEFIRIDSKKDFNELSHSHYYIISQGNISTKEWQSIKLSPKIFPSIYGSEYSMTQIQELSELVEILQRVFYQTPFEPMINMLIQKITNFTDVNELLSIEDELYLIRTQPVPKDKVLLLNLAEALKAIYHFANEMQSLPPKINKLFLDNIHRFSHSKIKISDINLYSHQLRINLFIKSGEITCNFITSSEPLWKISIQYPPESISAVELEKEYRRYLKEQYKLIDKNIAPQWERNILDFLEKLLEERIFYNEQRLRLQALTEALNLKLETDDSIESSKTKKLSFHMKLPYWLRIIVEFLKVPEIIDYLVLNKKRIQKKLSNLKVNKKS